MLVANMECQTVFAGETVLAVLALMFSVCLASPVKENPLHFNIKLTSLTTQFH